jgi:hypothetical protein
VIAWRFGSRHIVGMPHYFFDFHNDDVAVDEEGRPCADLIAARAWATNEARNVAAADVLRGSLDTSHRIDILDRARNLVGSVSFGEAIAIV